MKKVLKQFLKRFVGRRPHPAMSSDNLYAFLDALYRTRTLAGPVVEVGCAQGGTTVVACDFLRRIRSQRDYICIDTFSGFVEEQFQTDAELGVPQDHREKFSENSLQAVRANLQAAGVGNNVTLIQGDIVKIPADNIPNNISVCLLDVDLRDPIFLGLPRLWEKLAPGGVILIDDCKANTSWVGANVGYLDYVKQVSLAPKYFMGLGVVEKPGATQSLLDWDFENEAIEIPSH